MLDTLGAAAEARGTLEALMHGQPFSLFPTTLGVREPGGRRIYMKVM